MSEDWLDPEPFLRGIAWWDAGRPVRADPACADRMPWDTWERAKIPVGVRLEFTSGGAKAVEVRYSTSDPGPDAPVFVFSLLEGDVTHAEAAAVPGEDMVVRIGLPSGEGPFTLHLPDSLSPAVRAVRGLGGTPAPAPPLPRWLVYGDSITEGWCATRPALAWPAVAGRALGLDPLNLGYAGAARGELVCAEQLAGLDCALVTLAFGSNCWSRVPFSAGLMHETVRAFVAVVRNSHPDTPVWVVSPVLCPEAEDTPNALGATLADLRGAIERAVRALTASGDGRLALLPGGALLAPDQLSDGLHPDDSGHAHLAASFAEAVLASSPGLVPACPPAANSPLGGDG
ncbi:GDSL-type esterase/lipase family protein [Streptomyces beijiangensis]|uniref:GDSL family lipase n=1 Tax=Streptomyces beijiangensis TaxID=163361 RepID=A0A939FCM7_9ACTN|nr:GDSL-type esterase/lipase family protein [Streptomyces beijiangensis]MBO0515664.1 GDSL family lipase [Streptomyces beijiangensis]